MKLWSLTRFALEFHTRGRVVCWAVDDGWPHVAQLVQCRLSVLDPVLSGYSVQQWHLGGLLVMHECNSAQLFVFWWITSFKALECKWVNVIFYTSHSLFHIIGRKKTSNCILILGIRVIPASHPPPPEELVTVSCVINLEQLSNLSYSSFSILYQIAR